jgi:DNA-binding CsgD family transcriptional regulator
MVVARPLLSKTNQTEFRIEARVAFDDGVLSKILEVLYEAPTDPARWGDFLRLTAKAVEGESAGILMHDFNDVQSFVSQQWNMDPEATRKYVEHYTEKDVWFQSIRHSADWLGTSEQFVPFDELKRTEFYNDLILPYEVPHLLAAMVERTPSRVVNLSVYRGFRRGPFGPETLEPMRTLRPHIQRAYRLYRELAAARDKGTSLQAALDSVGTGVILVGQDLHILTSNRAADRLLAESDGLEAKRDRLRATRHEESENLQRLVSEACVTSAGQGAKPGGVLSVSRRKRPPLHVVVSPSQGMHLDEKKLARAVVLVTDPAEEVRPMAETLRIRYGLTPAESRLALLLVDGHSPHQIADMLGVSRNTVKTQLASIYNKTGASRQSQLVRLLVQLAPSAK